MVEQEALKFELLAFLSYLAVSARGCVDEPKLYGPFRLVDGMSRLIGILDALGVASAEWTELQTFIDEHKLDVMEEGTNFAVFLDEVVGRVVALLEKA